MEELMRSEPTARIRITRLPHGEAPLEIRQAWIGLELPCYPVLGHLLEPHRVYERLSTIGHEQGVLSGQDIERPIFGFSVPQDQAIQILEATRPDAAAWWKAHGFPHQDNSFRFKNDEVEIISGVRIQKIVHCPDEMMGDPFR